MANLLETIASLLTAGTMLISSAADLAAPHQDIDGTLFLANRQWMMSESYVPPYEKANVTGKLSMRPDAVKALEEMYAAAKAEAGVVLTAVSGYRSYSTQASIYSAKLKRVKSREKADAYVARPGASEHQLGLAMDVGQKNKVNLNAAFGNTKGGKWLAENCWRFGFIIRYQAGWEDVTGYSAEPWHVRYVGKEVAALLHEKEMPLETFLIIMREETVMEIVLGEAE